MTTPPDRMQRGQRCSKVRPLVYSQRMDARPKDEEPELGRVLAFISLVGGALWLVVAPVFLAWDLWDRFHTGTWKPKDGLWLFEQLGSAPSWLLAPQSGLQKVVAWLIDGPLCLSIAVIGLGVTIGAARLNDRIARKVLAGAK